MLTRAQALDYFALFLFYPRLVVDVLQPMWENGTVHTFTAWETRDASTRMAN